MAGNWEKSKMGWGVHSCILGRDSSWVFSERLCVGWYSESDFL